LIQEEAPGGDVREAVKKAFPLVAGLGLLLLLSVQAGLLLTNTIEERANRVIEVLASTLPIDKLFWGKLLGHLGVALVLAGAWGGGLTGFVLLADGPAMDLVRQAIAASLTPGVVLALIVYFLLGYGLFAAIYLGLGSLCTTLREVQTLLMPFNIALMVIVAGMMGIANDPKSTIAAVASWIPLATPFVMPARIVADAAAWWEVLATLTITGLTTVWVINAAARLFRQAALRGASAAPSLRELWGLVRGHRTA
jgi:ABC-2 type transport system permease protein